MDFIPFPRFSTEKLAIWFAQSESVFRLNGIETDSDKYDYIIAHIPLQYSSLVEDIILNPPPERRYDHIKYEFIKRMSIHGLKQERLDNDTPSEYLERLRSIADERVPIELILNTWLKNLPKPVRDIVSLEASGHVDIIGSMADKAMALLTPMPSHPQRNVLMSSDQLHKLMDRVEELSKKIHTMQASLGVSPCEEAQLPKS